MCEQRWIELNGVEGDRKRNRYWQGVGPGRTLKQELKHTRFNNRRKYVMLTLPGRLFRTGQAN